jgi:hypothetical protein
MNVVNAWNIPGAFIPRYVDGKITKYFENKPTPSA